MELHEFQDLTVQQVFEEAGYPSSDIHFCYEIGWRTWNQVWDRDNSGWVELPDCLHYTENQICLDKLQAIYVHVDIWPIEVGTWYQNTLNEYEILQ